MAVLVFLSLFMPSTVHRHACGYWCSIKKTQVIRICVVAQRIPFLSLSQNICSSGLCRNRDEAAAENVARGLCCNSHWFLRSTDMYIKVLIGARGNHSIFLSKRQQCENTGRKTKAKKKKQIVAKSTNLKQAVPWIFLLALRATLYFAYKSFSRFFLQLGFKDSPVTLTSGGAGGEIKRATCWVRARSHNFHSFIC